MFLGSFLGGDEVDLAYLSIAVGLCFGDSGKRPIVPGCVLGAEKD